MIDSLTRLMIPHALAREWRQWTMDRRAFFLQQVRQKFPSDRPATPVVDQRRGILSITRRPRAWEIVERDNIGLNSQLCPDKLKLSSEGVIYNDKLWYWCGAKCGGYFAGPYKPGVGRPSLHHVIWEETHGRKVPAACTVIFLDGNPNNFLRCKPRSAIARRKPRHQQIPLGAQSLACHRPSPPQPSTIKRNSQ